MNKKNWIIKNPLQEARSHFASTYYNGSIYCFGGGGENFKSLSSVEVYSPTEDKWRNLSPMPTIRSGLVAVTGSDKIYLIGGGFKNSDGKFTFYRTVEIYYPETDKWEAGIDMLMPHDYPASLQFNNKIYIIGGHHPDSNSGPLLDPGFDMCEIFDPESGTWQEGPALNVPRFAIAATSVGNTIYAFGGCRYFEDTKNFSNLSTVESYTQGEDGWVIDNKMKLPWNAAGAGSCSIKDKTYLFGGNSGKKIEQQTAVYDHNKKSWTLLPDMDQPRVVMGVHRVKDSIFIIGGRGADKKSVISSVIEYSPDIA